MRWLEVRGYSTMLKLSPFHVALLVRAEHGTLDEWGKELSAEYDCTPRWRWLRRFHLERQLIVCQFAIECRAIGWYKGLKSTVHERV